MKTAAYIVIPMTIITLILICVCCFIWLGVLATTGDNSGVESNGFTFNQTDIDDEFDTNKVAVISLEGVIFDGDLGPLSQTANVDSVIAQLELAQEQEDVVGIILNINSPGGEVVASDRVYRKVQEVSDQKPVVVYSGNTLASGAYYVAMGADYIVVNEFNISGSIGVYAEFYNFDGLYENVGIDVRRLTNSNGSFKLNEELFDDDTSDVPTQNLIETLDVVYERFVNIIVESRDISESELTDQLARGQVFDAYTAQENNLIDEIGTEEGAFEQVLRLADVDTAQRIQYDEQLGFFDVFTQPAVSVRNMFRQESGMTIYYQ